MSDTATSGNTMFELDAEGVRLQFEAEKAKYVEAIAGFSSSEALPT